LNTNISSDDKTHILVVEDDASLSEWISDYLTMHGYLVTVANRGDEAVNLVRSDEPDLVVLDIMLPVKDGFKVCSEIRAFYNRPILMLTARSEEVDEVLGLEIGADDYLCKPVKPRILLARIRALLRRDVDDSGTNTRKFGELLIDADSKAVYLGDKSIPVSTNEFDVLWLLASRAGEVVSRDELVRELRGFEYDGFDRSIDIRISRLRKKLKDNPSSPYKIKTVWGRGYLFVANAW
jgi:two-component system OmpR family response regulator/two-component system response regulator RstA